MSVLSEVEIQPGTAGNGFRGVVDRRPYWCISSLRRRMYGSSIPPDYHLSMVRTPVLLYWGNNDWLATPEDVENIAQNLPNLIASVRVREEALYSVLTLLTGC